MIGADHFDQAIIDSRRASADDPVVTMRDAGVDVEAVNALILSLIPAYVGLSPGETTAAAFAAGVELGVRAARAHDVAEYRREGEEIVYTKGQRVRLVEDVELEGGRILQAGTAATIDIPRYGNAVAITWRDEEGTHVLAVATSKIDLAD